MVLGRKGAGVLWNDGDGSFSLGLVHEDAGGTDGAAVADLDGDGRAELVIGQTPCTGGVCTAIYRFSGRTWERVNPSREYPLAGANPGWVQVADVDGNGLADLMFNMEDATPLQVLRAIGSPLNFAAPEAFPGGVWNGNLIATGIRPRF